jgi:O-antigen/teichoic acid export membrane protein
MNVYAYVSIIEVMLKLFAVTFFICFSFDKLKVYAALMFLVSVAVFFINRLYSVYKLPDCHYKYNWDKTLFTRLVGFSGWNMFGNLAGVAFVHGVNIILNMFLGTIVNAARTIALQVSALSSQFVSGIYTAINPQIIKSTAANDTDYLFQLINKASKLSFAIVFIIVLPVLIKTDEILTLWLGVVPEYTVTFTKLTLINTILGTYSASLITLIQAIGRIKKFQIFFGILFLSSIPIAYLLLKFGLNANYVILVLVILEILALLLRLITVKRQINFDIKMYFYRVILKTGVLAIIAIIIASHIDVYLYSGLCSLILNSMIYMLITILLFSLLCFSPVERKYVYHLFRK